MVSPLACGAALLCWVVDLWTGGPLILDMDASLRRDDVVLLRTSLLYRGTALPIAWVIVPANTPGAWESHWERMLRWIASVLPPTLQVLVLTDQGLWNPQLWAAIYSHHSHPVMGGDWQRGQLVAPDAVVWQYPVVAVATLWALTVGTRIEDAEQQGVPVGRVRQPPSTHLPLQPYRASGTAQRMVCLLQRGCQKLCWLLARGRQWVRLWLWPAPL
jgi:hypothetical protein